MNLTVATIGLIYEFIRIYIRYTIFSFFLMINEAVHCVPGLTYQECGNACHRSCRDLTHDAKCHQQCVAGCNCPNGTVLNDYDSCVPIGECPCQWEGNSYPAGHAMFKDKDNCERW